MVAIIIITIRTPRTKYISDNIPSFVLVCISTVKCVAFRASKVNFIKCLDKLQSKLCLSGLLLKKSRTFSFQILRQAFHDDDRDLVSPEMFV